MAKKKKSLKADVEKLKLKWRVQYSMDSGTIVEIYFWYITKIFYYALEPNSIMDSNQFFSSFNYI